MKPGGSTLNPYAKAYVPMAKREGYSGNEGSRNVVSEPHHVQQQWNVVSEPHHVQQPSHQAHGFEVQGTGSFTGSQMSMLPRDEDLDMDMEINYLLVMFSNLSHESINEVYMANNRDLDATMDMLTHLEIYSSEDQQYLPATLDIGDVPETTEPSTSTTSNQTNVNTDASPSSSSGIPKVNVPSS